MPVIASHSTQHVASFYLPWMAAAAASVHADVGANYVIVNVGGFEIPALRLSLAVIGVIISRLLAPRREPATGAIKNVLVTVVMLLAVAAWVIDARPGLLFTFVIAIGLGFSGYALLELAGREMEEFVRRVFARATQMIDQIGNPK